MNIVLLTQVTGILKPFAWIMGIILNAIYEFFNLFGIQNIALCIIIFTLVIKMLMLPLTIKQQKFTRLSSKMNPELTKIQEKYKNKKDTESIQRMQAEQQAVYQKYGTTPMGGCLPLIISIPIMFALYKVIYAVPAYVNDIGDLYRSIATAIEGISGHADEITAFLADQGIKNVANNLGTYAVGSTEYTNSLIDILYKFTADNWNAFFNTSIFGGLKSTFTGTVDQIISANRFLGLSILDSPTYKNIGSLLIPIFAVVSQILQTKVSGTAPNQNAKSDDPMAQSSTAMMKIMPLTSGIFCYMLPICVGIYWICSAVFATVQTIFINRYIDKTGIDTLIEKSVEKQTKKNEKLGIAYGNKMAEVAKTSTKAGNPVYENTEYDNTSYKKNNKKKAVSGADYQRSNVSYSSKSIAANANLLAQRASKAEMPAEADNTTAPSNISKEE